MHRSAGRAVASSVVMGSRLTLEIEAKDAERDGARFSETRSGGCKTASGMSCSGSKMEGGKMVKAVGLQLRRKVDELG